MAISDSLVYRHVYYHCRCEDNLGTMDKMTDFTLRPALETESAAIKELIHSVGINPMDLDWRRFIVAVDARDQIIAIGQIKPHGSKADIHELASIAVVPEYRGQG